MKKSASKKGSSKGLSRGPAKASSPRSAKQELYSAWRENKEFQRIIDDFESGPAPDNSPAMLMAVAGDYNTLGMMTGDHEMYFKAMLLLRFCLNEYAEDPEWHYRMAFCEYQLGAVSQGLEHFLMARELGHEDADAFIDECRLKLSVPRFDRTLLDRVKESWTLFPEQEQEIAALIDAEAMPEAGQRLADIFRKALRSGINIGTGTRRKKYTLTMSPRTDVPTLHKLMQIKKLMPEDIAARWEMRIGRRRYDSDADLGIGIGGVRVTPEDVRVWLVRDPERADRLCVALYCEKLLDQIRQKSKDVMFLLEALIDYSLGEVVSMRLIGPMDILDKPWKRNSFLLPELYGRLEKMGYNMEDDPERYLKKEAKFFHQVNNVQPENAMPRQDITDGWTLCPDLMQEYLDKKKPILSFPQLFDDGVAAGFIFFATECFAGEEDAYRTILQFVHHLEGFLRWKCGDTFVIIGKSSCATRFYVDFLVFGDLPAVLLAAEDFFLHSPVRQASWHSFTRQAHPVSIIQKEDYEL